MEPTAIPTQKRYTPENEPSWKKNPLCRTHTLEYRSEDKNVLGEPVFYQTEKDRYIIRPSFKSKFPLFKTKVKGYYTAYPEGLSIDQSTGEININTSNSGIKYTIGYISFDNKCVARTTIVIGGIAYEGGIFSLAKVEEHKNNPVFYGDRKNTREVPSRQPLKGRFFFTPPDVRNTADLQGLAIDPTTGEIDYNKTIRSGGLGFAKDSDYPENGVSKEFTIYYQLFLDDPRKETLQKTSVRIHFFNSVEDIPDDLQLRVSFHEYIIQRKTFSLPLLLATILYLFPESPWAAFGILVAALSSLLFLNLTKTTSSRPSETVITG